MVFFVWVFLGNYLGNYGFWASLEAGDRGFLKIKRSFGKSLANFGL
jgi:hypothetical protein